MPKPKPLPLIDRRVVNTSFLGIVLVTLGFTLFSNSSPLSEISVGLLYILVGYVVGYLSWTYRRGALCGFISGVIGFAASISFAFLTNSIGYGVTTVVYVEVGALFILPTLVGGILGGALNRGG